MGIGKLLKPEVMILSLASQRKIQAIDEMVQRLYDTGYISDQMVFKEAILAREAQTTTGLGDGIAMPHAQSAVVREPVVLFAKSQEGVDYESLDGKVSRLFFMIAVPMDQQNLHLEAIADLSRQLLVPNVVEALMKADSPEAVLDVFAHDSTCTPQELAEDDELLVAVTACPTGIAHTYMAEAALIEAAKKMQVALKVETNGASGVGNALTSDDINRAKAVIVAADKAVEMSRFTGKPLLMTSVTEGIKHPEKLIEQALLGRLEVYQGEQVLVDEEARHTQGLGKAFYKHLMSGVSAMLPFVIAGGILIALAFLIDQILGVPQAHLASLGSYSQLASYFKTVGGLAFGFMLPVLAGYIAQSIAQKPGLIAGFVAGGMAANGLAIDHVAYGVSSTTTGLSGVPSGFLGALVGGFLAGGVVKLLQHLLKGLPQALDGIKAILVLPLFGSLITGALMLLINIPMSAINTSLNKGLDSLSGSSVILLAALVGGMMAVDMGGPVNKAAYVFATGTLASSVASGGSVVMAAVMAAGMVPPLAVFVATRAFSSKFSPEERNSGWSNIVMGLSFITEGAIPFGAADPIRAIPAFVIGSALTGALVGFSEIKLMAPHGGIFVIGLTSQPILYLAYIVIGSLVSGLVFGALKRTK